MTDTYSLLSREEFRSLPLVELLLAREAASSAEEHTRTDAVELHQRADALARAMNARGGTIPLLAITPGGEAHAGERPSIGRRTQERVAEPAPGNTRIEVDADRADVFASLSERERTVVALVVRGLSYAQIAEELFVTRSTVSFHLTKCYAKTNTRSRHELASLARSVLTARAA